MTVDKMTVDHMTIDKMTVDHMTIDKMTVDKMPLHKITFDEMLFRTFTIVICHFYIFKAATSSTRLEMFSFIEMQAFPFIEIQAKKLNGTQSSESGAIKLFAIVVKDLVR